MKLHLIRERPAVFRRHRLIHHCLFHGFASRQGGTCKVLDWPAAFLTNDVRSPLQVVRNGAWVPEICSPGVNFVVSEPVREALEEFAPIEFLRVDFVKLINFAVPKNGDILGVNAPNCCAEPASPKNFLRTRKDVPEFHTLIGPRFEVLAARVADIRDRYRNLREVRARVGSACNGGEPVEVTLSKRMCEEYAVLCDTPWIFREDAFAVVAPWLDWNFYMQTEVVL